jgi:hypothetical protein
MTKPYTIYTAVKGPVTEHWTQIGDNGPVWGPFASEDIAEEFGRNYTGTPRPTEEQVLCPTCKKPITEEQYVDPSAHRNFFD